MANDKELDIIQDIPTEGITIGSFINKPELFNEYLELISPEYDFSDESLRFMYRILVNTFLNCTKIDEIAMNVEVSKMDTETQESYKALGGYKSFVRLSNVAKSHSDFAKTYTTLKTYNMLRELDKKGFNVRKYIDKLKDKSPDQILRSYEMQLSKVGSYIKGINDSVILGKGLTAFYQSLKIAPDIGMEIPFGIINGLARGWRTSKIYASGMHSGMGKSREVAYMLTFTSILRQEPVLLIVNEQDLEEWNLMILTAVANNLFGQKYGLSVDEDEIAMGKCTGEKDRMVQEASEFIEARSKIYFLETNVYDFDSLKIVLKQHKLKGINHAIIDTFKPFRGGNDSQGMAEWQQFVYTVERMKRIIGSKVKGGLDMALWITFQLTDESLTSKILNSTAIASGKQIKHNLDFIKMSRALDYKDKEKIKVKIEMLDNPFNGQIQALDKNKDYYMTLLDKNRGGKDKKYIIYEVDKGKIIFKELGWAIFNSEEDEQGFIAKLDGDK